MSTNIDIARTSHIEGRYWPTDARRPGETTTEWCERLDTYPPHREPPDDGPDLGECPYYARFHGLPGADPQGTCASGCVDEPKCVTCVPVGGWPSVVARLGGDPE